MAFAAPYDREEAAPPGGREASPDDALRQIAQRLTRFEQSVDIDDADIRKFQVWVDHMRVGIRIKVSRDRPKPWCVSLMVDGMVLAQTSGANAIDALRDTLNYFFYTPEAAPYLAAGFETSAIVTEFTRVGQWLTLEEQDELSEERRARAMDLAERVKPEIERMLREQGVDTEDLRVKASSASPIWAWRPRMKIELEFGEPLKE